VGLFVGLGMLLFAAFRRMLRGPVAAPAARQAEESVIEGEYSVVDKRPAALSLQ
jgi:hypothetical protein